MIHGVGKCYECHQGGQALSSSSSLQLYEKLMKTDVIEVSPVLKALTITGVFR